MTLALREAEKTSFSLNEVHACVLDIQHMPAWRHQISDQEKIYEMNFLLKVQSDLFFNTSQYYLEIKASNSDTSTVVKSLPLLHGDLYILPTNNTFFSFCKRKLITLIIGNKLIKWILAYANR